jgi:excisionase family DNA binding protein
MPSVRPKEEPPREAGSFSTKYQRLITYAELAEYLGVSVRYILILVKKGRIQRIKLGKRSVKFDLEDVMRRLKQGV